MKLFFIGEYYAPLKDWFAHDGKPKGVPAVYNLYQYLGNHPKHKIHARIYTYDLNRKIELPNGSTITLVQVKVPIYLLWKLCVYIIWVLKGGKYIKKQSPDIIYAQGSFVSIAAYWGRKLSIPSVGRIYGTILTQLVKKRDYFNLYTRNILEIIGIKNPCDLMICTQDGTAYDEVGKFFKSDFEVELLYNGMESKIRKQLLGYQNVSSYGNDSTIKIASIARLFPYKRHELSILLCKSLKEKNIPTQLSIIGSGSEEKSLKALVVKLNLLNEVTFIPELSQVEMLDWLPSQDICTLFYAGGSLGNVMWECALAGRLIITVDNGRTSSVIHNDKNGIIFPDDERLVERCSKSIEKYLTKDISDLTYQLREDIAKIIPEWGIRFDREMDLIEKRLLRK